MTVIRIILILSGYMALDAIRQLKKTVINLERQPAEKAKQAKDPISPGSTSAWMSGGHKSC